MSDRYSDQDYYPFNFQVGTTIKRWRGIDLRGNPGFISDDCFRQALNVRPYADGHGARGGQLKINATALGAQIDGIFETKDIGAVLAPPYAIATELVALPPGIINHPFKRADGTYLIARGPWWVSGVNTNTTIDVMTVPLNGSPTMYLANGGGPNTAAVMIAYGGLLSAQPTELFSVTGLNDSGNKGHAFTSLGEQAGVLFAGYGNRQNNANGAAKIYKWESGILTVDHTFDNGLTDTFMRQPLLATLGTELIAVSHDMAINWTTSNAMLGRLFRRSSGGVWSSVSYPTTVHDGFTLLDFKVADIAVFAGKFYMGGIGNTTSASYSDLLVYDGAAVTEARFVNPDPVAVIIRLYSTASYLYYVTRYALSGQVNIGRYDGATWDDTWSTLTNNSFVYGLFEYGGTLFVITRDSDGFPKLYSLTGGAGTLTYTYGSFANLFASMTGISALTQYSYGGRGHIWKPVVA